MGLPKTRNVSDLFDTSLKGNATSPTLELLSDRPVRPVRNFSEYCQALRLVYHRYMAAGFMEENLSGFRVFVRDLLPTADVFVATADNRVYGTVTGNIYGPASLPLSKLFPEELNQLTSLGGLIAEGTKLACAEITSAEPKHAGGLGTTAIELLRWIFSWCTKRSVANWMIVVHPRVKDFYRNDLGFEEVAEISHCSHVADNPGSLLRLNVDQLICGAKTPTSAARRFFLSTKTWNWGRHGLYRLSPCEVALLLLEDLNLLADASENDTRALKHFYPQLQLDQFIATTNLYRTRSSFVTPSLLASKIRLKTDDSGVLIERHSRNTPVCFALRAHLSRLQILIGYILQAKGARLRIIVADDVPDGLVADPILLGRILIVLFEDSPGLFDKFFQVTVQSTRYAGNHLTLTIRFENITREFWRFIEEPVLEMNGAMVEESVSDHSNLKSNDMPRDCLAIRIPANVMELAPHLCFNGLSSDLAEMHPIRMNERPMRVMVVEDNRVNQIILKRFLTKLGIDFEICGNAQATLDCSASSSFDLILMDIQLPDGSGLEVTRQLRQREVGKPTTPIYAMTSFVMSGDKARCSEAGMDGYLPKPLSLSVLRDLLKTLASKNGQVAEFENERVAS